MKLVLRAVALGLLLSVLIVGPRASEALQGDEERVAERGFFSGIFDTLKGKLFGREEEVVPTVEETRIPIKGQREEIERTKEKILRTPIEEKEIGWLEWILLKLSHVKDSLFGKIESATEKAHEKAEEFVAECRDNACRLKNAAAKKGKDAAEGAQRAKEAVKGKVADMKESASRLGEQAKEYAEETEESILDKAEKIKESAKQKVYDAKDTIKAKAEDIKEGIKEKAEDIKEGIKEKAASARDTVKEKAEDIKEGIKEGAANVRDTIKEKFENVKEGAKEYGRRVRESLEEDEEAAEEYETHRKQPMTGRRETTTKTTIEVH